LPRSGSYGKALAEQHMPGNVHSMQLEHALRDFQTDRGCLFTHASFGGSSIQVVY
jgi:hypothetical protein